MKKKSTLYYGYGYSFYTKCVDILFLHILEYKLTLV